MSLFDSLPAEELPPDIEELDPLKRLRGLPVTTCPDCLGWAKEHRYLCVTCLGHGEVAMLVTGAIYTLGWMPSRALATGGMPVCCFTAADYRHDPEANVWWWPDDGELFEVGQERASSIPRER